MERDAQSGGGVLAAAVAFRLFMFLVPYAFVMVTGFGLASTAAGQDPGDAARSAGIGGLLASAVASTSTLSLANRLVALVLGGFALALTARSFVRVLWIVHRLIWRVQPQRKPSPWAPLILVGFVTVLFGLGDLITWIGSQSLGLRFVAFVMTIVISAGAWFLASWFLPRDDCALWALLPGALIVGVGVGVLQILTFTYVVHVVTRKSALYGAIGIALALLLWTYFAGRLLTAAIAANASLWKHRTGQEQAERRATCYRRPEAQARDGGVGELRPDGHPLLPDRRRVVVAHAVDLDVARAGNDLRRMATAARVDQGVPAAVDHQGGQVQRGQLGGAGAVRA